MTPHRYAHEIAKRNLTIYDHIEVGDPDLWIPSRDLEVILNDALQGMDLDALPLRTRSKVVKSRICEALGYPVPTSFKRTRPRFPGQNFDVYVQKANNLQIWNEEIAPARRYVIIHVSRENRIDKIKVISGATLARLDTTGRLTRKYQAVLRPGPEQCELVSSHDTANIMPLTNPLVDLTLANPTQDPCSAQLLPIKDVFDKLCSLVGYSFRDAGVDQERNRGKILQELVCARLGYSTYQEDGQFPDIRHQLLEVKLQTSPTIDLGTLNPASNEPLDIPMIDGVQITPKDVRYAIFYASIEDQLVTITHFYLVTGEQLFSRFPQMRGQEVNTKLQIHLRDSFWEE